MIQISNMHTGREPMLLPERDAPYSLAGVYERVTDGCRGTLTLQCDNCYLAFHVDEDNDTLEVEFHETAFVPSSNDRSLATAAPWTKYVGREFGWTWLTVNQQGYCDGSLLSFDGIVPGVLLHVVASSIEVFTIALAASECNGTVVNLSK